MFRVTVALPSGQSETCSLPQSSTVGDLRILAQKSASCGARRWRPPDSYCRRSKASSNTLRFFALFCPGGDRLVIWGHHEWGCDSSLVQDQLEGVQQVQASQEAFAAILADGSVVTWGSPFVNGGSFAVQDQLKGVQQVQATSGAFAAILPDGLVVTWGTLDCGDSSAVTAQLASVSRNGGAKSLL